MLHITPPFAVKQDFIVKGQQTIDFYANGQKLREMDAYGNSGLRFTTNINLTRGVTIRKFANVRVGLKIIVPGHIGMYRKNRKRGETRIKTHSNRKIPPNSSFPTHLVHIACSSFSTYLVHLMTYFMREKKDTT